MSPAPVSQKKNNVKAHYILMLRYLSLCVLNVMFDCKFNVRSK